MRQIHRRELLKGISMLAATAVVGDSSAWGFRASQPTSPIRLGVASYSLRKLGPPEVIRALREFNTPNLNVKDVHLPMSPFSAVGPLSEKYRAAGLSLTAAGTIYFAQDDDTDMRAKFEYVKAAGIGLIVAGPTPATLPRLERFANEYDVRIAIHNHGPEDQYFPSPLDAWRAVKGMGPRMGICLDVGHTARCGANVPEAIREVGSRLYDVHMKDLRRDGDQWTQVAVGDGNLPVKEIFAALSATHYAGFVDLEYEIHEDDPLPGMSKSFAYMRGVLAGMGYQA